MKYLNQNYINCLRKYYGKNQDCANIKIIGKIDYNSAYINSSITDKNLGLLISGIITEKDNKVETKLNKGNAPTALKNQIKNMEMPKVTKDIEIKIMKESKENKIYKKESDGDESNEIKEIKMNQLFSPHILLYQFNETNFIGKKRNPTSLFGDEILGRKRKKN